MSSMSLNRAEQDWPVEVTHDLTSTMQEILGMGLLGMKIQAQQMNNGRLIEDLEKAVELAERGE